jgi:hypothetical protein
MKSVIFLALTLTACGARARVDLTEEPTPTPTEPTDTPTSPSASELVRTIDEPCAFGAGAGHLVWIDAATHAVNVARAVPGSTAKHLGNAAGTCALAVLGTRFCFGDAAGSLTCMDVDGAEMDIHGERRASDPVRAIDLGRGPGLIFARRRTVYGRLYEDTFTTTTTTADVVGVAGDWEPSPDDGVELAVTTVNALQRISYGETKPISIAPSLAVSALHYSAYLVLGADGELRTVHAHDGLTRDLGLAGVQAFAHSDRTQGDNLVVAREGQIVAMNAQLYFEPKVSRSRVVAPANGDVVSIALDDADIVWATRGGEIRRAKREIE